MGHFFSFDNPSNIDIFHFMSNTNIRCLLAVQNRSFLSCGGKKRAPMSGARRFKQLLL